MTASLPDAVRAASGAPSRRRGGTAPVAAVLVLLAIGFQVAMDATAVQDDAFDSPLYWWTWLIYPASAVAASVWRPKPVAALGFTAALVVPSLIGTFWPIAEIINLVQGAVILVCAMAGAGAGHLVRRWRQR